MNMAYLHKDYYQTQKKYYIVNFVFWCVFDGVDEENSSNHFVYSFILKQNLSSQLLLSFNDTHVRPMKRLIAELLVNFKQLNRLFEKLYIVSPK